MKKVLLLSFAVAVCIFVGCKKGPATYTFTDQTSFSDFNVEGVCHDEFEFVEYNNDVVEKKHHMDAEKGKSITFEVTPLTNKVVVYLVQIGEQLYLPNSYMFMTTFYPEKGKVYDIELNDRTGWQIVE